jgi:RNA polymerase sigma factor (sigma-70 family)
VKTDVDTDSVLIMQSVCGRPDAFVEVVRRHETAVHSFVARRSGSQAADDLLGEVWVRAFAGRNGYDLAHDDARPWLYGIARNVLRAHWGTARHASHSAVEGVVDPWDEVVDRLDSAARTRELADAQRALPPGEREVLLLVAWEELTPAQAAVALGVPQGTVRSRLHRARIALRRVLRQAQVIAAQED